MNYAGFWRRAAAVTIDSLVMFPMVGLLFLATRVSSQVAMLTYLLVPLVNTGYFVYMYKTYGQTLGKMAAGIRVVKVDGSNLSYKEAVLRKAVDFGFAILSAGFQIGALSKISDSELTSMGFMSWAKRLNELAPEVQLLNYVVYAWMILQIVVVLVNPQKRAIHDFIAGTLQVRLAPPAPPVLEAGTKPLT